jgi:hypothetical protein
VREVIAGLKPWSVLGNRAGRRAGSAVLAVK